MNRWVALLVAVAGGAILSFFLTIGLVVGLYGVLWIFVFGDASWPAWIVPAFNLAIPLLGLAIWAGFGWIIWSRLQARAEEG